MNDSNTRAQDAKREATSQVESLRDTAQQEGRKLAGTVGELGQQRAEQTFEQGKQVAEGHVDAVQSAIGDAAQRLDEEGHPFASYASELSGQLSSLSDRIEHSSLDELVSDGRRVARENPGLFMLGAVAVGFAASRFLKASDQRSESEYLDGPDSDAFEDDIDEVAYARATGYRRTRPYRRAARPPVQPVARDSAVNTAAGDVTTPRVNPPVNDLDAATARPTSASSTATPA